MSSRKGVKYEKFKVLEGFRRAYFGFLRDRKAFVEL
jgi:hypothetical protein